MSKESEPSQNNIKSKEERRAAAVKLLRRGLKESLTEDAVRDALRRAERRKDYDLNYGYKWSLPLIYSTKIKRNDGVIVITKNNYVQISSSDLLDVNFSPMNPPPPGYLRPKEIPEFVKAQDLVKKINPKYDIELYRRDYLSDPLNKEGFPMRGYKGPRFTSVCVRFITDVPIPNYPAQSIH